MGTKGNLRPFLRAIERCVGHEGIHKRAVKCLCRLMKPLQSDPVTGFIFLDIDDQKRITETKILKLPMREVGCEVFDIHLSRF